MAASLAAKIENQTGVKSNLIAGRGGIFDVEVDGELIFSKHETGSFPDEEELLGQLE